MLSSFAVHFEGTIANTWRTWRTWSRWNCWKFLILQPQYTQIYTNRLGLLELMENIGKRQLYNCMPCLSILAVQQCFDSISCELCLEEKLRFTALPGAFRGKGDSPLAGNRRSTDKWSGPMLFSTVGISRTSSRTLSRFPHISTVSTAVVFGFFMIFSICFCSRLETRCSTPWRSHGGAKPYWFTSRWTVRTLELFGTHGYGPRWAQMGPESLSESLSEPETQKVRHRWHVMA